MRRKTIDYDALLKEFVSDFFPEFVAFVHPALYAAIDWDKGFVFLEQELINTLRGKFKIRGKRRHTDKLVKVYLRTGAEHFIFVHVEFQHKPEKAFARRMFLYRTLIHLRYGIEDITAFAIFTSTPPPEEERFYRKDTFGTRVEYQFSSIVAVELAEELLLKAVDNAFAVAMLAAQYAYRSKNDAQLRLALKSKLFNLLRSRTNLNFDRTVKLFIFVRDLVHLPQKLENEFQETQFSLVFPTEEKMIISQGTKDFAQGLFERVFGYNPAQLLEEQKKMEKERRKVEKEKLKAEEQRMKAEEERQQLLQQTILNLHQLAQMEAAQIALMVGINVEEVEAILTAHAAE